MDQLFSVVEGTIWLHILFGKDANGVSIVSEIQDEEIDKLLSMLPTLMTLLKSHGDHDVRGYLYDKLAEYDESDVDRIYYLKRHVGFKFLKAFIKDGRIEDGVESFIHRISHDMSVDLVMPRPNYGLILNSILTFYSAGLLPLSSLDIINYGDFMQLYEIYRTYIMYQDDSELVFDINSEYFISYHTFMQMSENKKKFISSYFSYHSYLMRGKSIFQLLLNRLITVNDLVSLTDDTEFGPQICEIIDGNTREMERNRNASTVEGVQM